MPPSLSQPSFPADFPRSLRTPIRDRTAPVPASAAARRILLAFTLAAGLAACTTAPPFEGVGRPAPPGAPPGTCWDAVIIPARVETITEQVMVSPPVKSTDGRLLEPAVFASETRQEILRPREERFFEIPCPSVQTPDYLASLQRALAARDLYTGPITGSLTPETRAAIRRYQAPLGIDSPTLSLEAARGLGLSAIVLPD